MGGEGWFTKRSQRITFTRKGWGACKRIGQTEGANKGNDYSQDLLSMGGSRGYIFIYQY